VIDRIDDFDAVAAVLGASEATDVTGGMAGKVRTLLDLEAEASIFGLDALESFLDGADSGTTID
jgi:isopentenyl phosphate kinase